MSMSMQERPCADPLASNLSWAPRRYLYPLPPMWVSPLEGSAQLTFRWLRLQPVFDCSCMRDSRCHLFRQTLPKFWAATPWAEENDDCFMPLLYRAICHALYNFKKKRHHTWVGVQLCLNQFPSQRWPGAKTLHSSFRFLIEKRHGYWIVGI